MTDLTKSARAYLRSIAAKGGAAGTGQAKARSSEQARAAVCARWARFYALSPEEQAERRRKAGDAAKLSKRRRAEMWIEAAKKRAKKGKA